MVVLSHVIKWEVLHLSTGLASPALHRLHSVVSDFRPTSVTESGEAALRRLLASRVNGGYSYRFPIIASRPDTGCLWSSLPCVIAQQLGSFLPGYKKSSVCMESISGAGQSFRETSSLPAQLASLGVGLQPCFGKGRFRRVCGNGG